MKPQDFIMLNEMMSKQHRRVELFQFILNALTLIVLLFLIHEVFLTENKLHEEIHVLKSQHHPEV